MKEANNPIPQGKYAPATRCGNIAFSAGMTPRINGQLILTGKVTSQKPLEFYKAAVIQAADNAFCAISNMLDKEERIQKVLFMTVYVHAEDPFDAHSKLADYASQYLIDKIGTAGIAARAAIGVASLPGNAPVEIQIVCQIDVTEE